MMDKLFRNKKTRLRNLMLVILPFILLIGVFGFFAFSTITGVINNTSGGGSTPASSKYVIEEMGYSLPINATDLQKEYFQELKKAVENKEDKGEIARLVAKNYVADFYTWTNKYGSYDVGGLSYIMSSEKNNVFVRARNTYYKYLTFYINKLGSENLLEVVDVQVEGGDTPGTYQLNGNTYPSYFVVCRWDYKNEDKMSDVTKAWIKKLNFTVIENDNGRFEIAEAYGDE